jgi:hypothetical protein
MGRGSWRGTLFGEFAGDPATAALTQEDVLRAVALWLRDDQGWSVVRLSHNSPEVREALKAEFQVRCLT